MSSYGVIGANGMLGSNFCRELEKRGMQFTAYTEEDLDIANAKTLEVINKNHEIIINCAAYTAVDNAETQEEIAMAVNADGAGNLAEFCNKHGMKLVHFSTDYVFDGEKASGYVEEDECNPISKYGLSKYLGEKKIVENTNNYLILRTAWLFGSNGKNFVNTIWEVAKNRSELSIVSDQIGSPTYSADLVGWTLELIKRDLSGIYHTVNSGHCSWFEYAKEIVKNAGLNTVVKPILAKEYNSAAKRPACSVMITNKLEKAINYKPRKWQEALSEYMNSTKL